MPNCQQPSILRISTMGLKQHYTNTNTIAIIPIPVHRQPIYRDNYDFWPISISVSILCVMCCQCKQYCSQLQNTNYIALKAQVSFLFFDNIRAIFRWLQRQFYLITVIKDHYTNRISVYFFCPVSLNQIIWIWIWIVSQQGPKLGHHTDGVHDYGAA